MKTNYVVWVRRIGITGWVPELHGDSREQLEHQTANVQGPYSVLILPAGEFPWFTIPATD